MSEPTPNLRKAITLKYAVALYVSSVLGPGILVVPGLAAQVAGPASILAWIFLSFASYPFAYTFASLSARKAESGGVYSFSKESFGVGAGTVTSWLFAFWFITGAPAVTLIAASYLGYAFPLSRPETFVAATAVLFATFAVNYRGIVVSSKVQLAVIISTVALLVTAVVSSSRLVRPENFVPFAPFGLIPVGTAAALIFWSFLGYENVSNVAEEFRDPKRDFHRSILLSVLLIGVLYISVSIVTVGTLAYMAGGSVAPFAAILSSVVGEYGAAGTAILGAFIIFGTGNAYMTGMSRVVYAAARDGAFPKFLDHVDPRTGAPNRALAMLFGSAVVVLVIFYFLGINLETALLIPSGAAILVYVFGSAAGIRLLKRKDENSIRIILPWISLAISIAILPFVGVWIFASLAVVAVAWIYWSYNRRAHVIRL
ncbi:MAG TPA: amino acid permease [Nitrososphaerales archaeon]|nr:amino acid permease [Nitrososphaerales archaeon]